MTLTEYLKTQFTADLATLEFKKPNSVILNNPDSFKIDRNTIYFGGRDWSNIDNDIRQIKSENLEWFFLCLFTITVIDLTIYAHFNEHYHLFRNRTMYPKFGWSGFGPHYENPKKLLHIPQQRGLIDESKINENLNEYIDLFKQECNSFFNNHLPTIETDEFINILISDKDFKINDNDRNSVFESIYNKLADILIE